MTPFSNHIYLRMHWHRREGVRMPALVYFPSLGSVLSVLHPQMGLFAAHEHANSHIISAPRVSVQQEFRRGL